MMVPGLAWILDHYSNRGKLNCSFLFCLIQYPNSILSVPIQDRTDHGTVQPDRGPCRIMMAAEGLH